MKAAGGNTGSSGVGFPSTLWSQVLSAGRGSKSALETLSRRYEPVVLKLVSWFLSGHDARGHDPEDVAQEFFLHLVEQPAAVFGRADRDRGRFRAWLRSCLRHWLLNWADRVRAEKRGGKAKFVGLDAGAPDVAAGADLEKEFDRQWARDIVARVVARLHEDAKQGRLPALDLQVWERRYGAADPSAASVAKDLGVTENVVVTSLRRTARAFRSHLASELESTVTTASELEDEVRELLKSLG